MKNKTREEELCVLLDMVFDSAQEPDRAKIQLYCFIGRTQLSSAWLVTELLKLLWLSNEDQAAFDTEIWRIVNVQSGKLDE